MTDGLGRGEPTRRTVARVLPVDPGARSCCCSGVTRRCPRCATGSPSAARPTRGSRWRRPVCASLREETGIRVEPEALGEPFGTFEVEFSWNGRPYVNESTLFAVGVEETPISLRGAGPAGVAVDLRRTLVDPRGPRDRRPRGGPAADRPDAGGDRARPGRMSR
ncbi:hypothetical protein G5V59_05125 [Nocardioides sp. W3-2-3]|nr:hypothetical protein [Nocardioides convexus]NGZ99865.1 hypothetical protein [Nocardioides convexus]